MTRYVLSRLAWTVVVLWAIVTLTFAATFLSPIDPARSYAGLRGSEQVVRQVRHDFGLDQPLLIQYGRYVERVALGAAGSAWYARMLRSTVLNILGEDYVRMARAKGMPERVVILRHVLRNAVSPVVAMIGLDLGVFLGGVLVVERVFAWPGIGSQAWQAIQFNDIPMAMRTLLVP